MTIAASAPKTILKVFPERIARFAGQPQLPAARVEPSGLAGLWQRLFTSRSRTESWEPCEAFFDDQGLHLRMMPAGAESRAEFIAYAEMTQIVTLDVPVVLGRAPTWRRLYRVFTNRPGAAPHVEMTTMRSLDSVVSTLNCLKRLPATQHLQIPETSEVAAPQVGKRH
jgi:hypothetical protein